MHIRSATPGDVPALTALSEQLGYPAVADEVASRLGRFLARPDVHAVLVATTDEAQVIGWIHIGRRESLETRPRAEILGLVVDRAVRRTGVGRVLMSAAERWAAEQGFNEVMLRSNILRPESHPFYESIGYVRTKTQHVYLKAVAPRR